MLLLTPPLFTLTRAWPISPLAPTVKVMRPSIPRSAPFFSMPPSGRASIRLRAHHWNWSRPSSPEPADGRPRPRSAAR